MTKSLEIGGKQMLSIRYASERIGYSHDYVTRLAREGKISATQVGRNWFVDMDSVQQYVAAMELEQKLRQQQLSEERKRELQLSEFMARQGENSPLQLRNLLSPVVRVGVFASLALLAVFVGAAQFSHLTGGNGQVAAVQQTSQIEVSVARAAGTTEETQLNFSHESSRLSTLGDAGRGVLLLPEQAGTSSLDVTQLFSDDVSVVTDEKTGEKFVARLNSKGEVVEKIPFVVVPVTNTKTP